MLGWLAATIWLAGCNIVQEFPRPDFADATTPDIGAVDAGTDDVGPDAAEDASGNPPCEPCQTVSVQVASSDGDAEECPDGEVGYGDAALQLTRDDSDGCDGEQTVGVFFASVDVPAGATIHDAAIQFTAASSGSEATNLVIWGENGINPPDFDGIDSNVSNRPRLPESIEWTGVEAWAAQGDAGPAQRTPDLSAIVQRLVDQPGWAAGNAMAFILTGSGQRVAVAYDAEPSESAELEISYSPP